MANQNQAMGNASNEKREQRIMMLRGGFQQLEYVTVDQAAQRIGYTPSTIRKWALDGNIPLIESNNKTVVPMTADNKPTHGDITDEFDMFMKYLNKKHVEHEELS